MITRILVTIVLLSNLILAALFRFKVPGGEPFDASPWIGIAIATIGTIIALVAVWKWEGLSE